MKSASECFHNATRCDQMATNTRDTSSRALLRKTADQWRALGDQSQAWSQSAKSPQPPRDENTKARRRLWRG